MESERRFAEKSKLFSNKKELADKDQQDFNKQKWDWNKLVISPENRCKIFFETLLSFMALFEICYISYR